MTVHLVAHLQNRSSHYTSQVLQKSHQAYAPSQTNNDNKTEERKRRAADNWRLAQWRVSRLITGIVKDLSDMGDLIQKKKIELGI